MTRARAVGVVAAVALLIVVAQPAAAAHTTAVVSIHTTEADFNNADTLDQVVVWDSGNAGRVRLAGQQDGTTASLNEGDFSDTGNTQAWGITIRPNTFLTGVRVELVSGMASTADTVQVIDSTGSVIGTGTVSGDTATINVNLSSGENYALVPRANSGSPDLWRHSTASLPVSSPDVDIVGDSTGSTSTGGSDAYNIHNVTAITPEGPGTYVGPNHSADNIASGFTNITVTNASATVTWQAWDGNTWVDKATNTYTSDGNKSVALSGSESTWRVNVTFQNETGNGDPVASLYDEGVQVNTVSPTVDNGSASPSGGKTVTDRSVTLSIDIQDADFPTSQGDTATGTFYVDGNSVGAASRSSNGTLSLTTTVSTGGDHTWHVDVADDYGHTQTSQTFAFSAPAELKVYNESNATQLVDGVTTELRFYFQNGSVLIVEKNTSDGTINMSGLPADRAFIVVADAPGYHSRRIYVESLYDTQRIYLLPESKPHRNVVFDLEDFSGRFPEEDTVMLVQRALKNGSGNTTWQTVHGDFFGATGQFPATLRYNVRHRLILINTETGYRLNKRNYTPFANATETVRVTASGVITVRNNAPDVSISPATRSLPARNTTIHVQLSENDGNVSSWGLEIIYDNGSNTTLVSKTYSSPQSVSHDVNLTNRTNGSVHVVVNWTLASGTTGTEAATFTVREYFDNDYSLLAVLGTVTQRLPSRNVGMFTSMVAILSTVLVMSVVATQLRASPEIVGFAGVLGLAGWGLIGWIGYGTVFIAALAYLTMSALGRGI